jgi:hypothetical protein
MSRTARGRRRGADDESLGSEGNCWASANCWAKPAWAASGPNRSRFRPTRESQRIGPTAKAEVHASLCSTILLTECDAVSYSFFMIQDETKQDESKALAKATKQRQLDTTEYSSVFASEAAFAVAHRMATVLSRSSLMPAAYQGEANIPNIMIAMELADRIKASVFMVAQNLDIIYGRTSWRSQFLIATVNASGHFTPLRFRWQGKPGEDDWGCRAYATDTKSGDELVGSLITIGLSKAKGWWSRKDSHWPTMPEQMCIYRAAAWWTRAYAPGLGCGIPTTDEQADAGPPTVSHVFTSNVAEEPDVPTLGPKPSRLDSLAEKIAAKSEPVAVAPPMQESAPAPSPKAETIPAPAAQLAENDEPIQCVVCGGDLRGVESRPNMVRGKQAGFMHTLPCQPERQPGDDS